MKGVTERCLDEVLMVREPARACSGEFKVDEVRFDKNIDKNWFAKRGG